MAEQSTPPTSTPAPASSETPFGTMQVTSNRAPTGRDICANPGKWAGTSFDPLIGCPTILAVSRFSELFPEGRYFASASAWWTADPEGCQLWWASVYQTPGGLDPTKLSDGQKKQLGL